MAYRADEIQDDPDYMYQCGKCGATYPGNVLLRAYAEELVLEVNVGCPDCDGWMDYEYGPDDEVQ